ncbi:MAG: hypothetical protein P1U74_05985 [Legionellaceae bacterium]|nr:hypothetical protein [Legionellaceae bacterium]
MINATDRSDGLAEIMLDAIRNLDRPISIMPPGTICLPQILST